MQAERIAAGHITEAVQEQSSFLYHCYEGSGRTIVEPPNGERIIFEVDVKDTFAVPAWSKIQHINDLKETAAYLVGVNDQPFINLLGLLRPTS